MKPIYICYANNLHTYEFEVVIIVNSKEWQYRRRATRHLNRLIYNHSNPTIFEQHSRLFEHYVKMLDVYDTNEAQKLTKLYQDLKRRKEGKLRRLSAQHSAGLSYVI